MEKAVILDIDGVVNDWVGNFDRNIKRLLELFSINVNIKYRHETYAPELIGSYNQSVIQWWEGIQNHELLLGGRILPLAAEGIARLIANGLVVILLTAREKDRLTYGSKTLTEGKLTRDWLSENGVAYHNLIFSRNKAEVVKTLKAQYDIVAVVDDSPFELERYINEGISAMKVPYKYNQYIKVKEVKNLLELSERLEKNYERLCQLC